MTKSVRCDKQSKFYGIRYLAYTVPWSGIWIEAILIQHPIHH